LLCSGRNVFGGGFFGISKDDEPFGWSRGTVRGIITIWIVLMFCIISMWSFISGAMFIPIEWFLGIVAMVIGSYFYSRFRVNV